MGIRASAGFVNAAPSRSRRRPLLAAALIAIVVLAAGAAYERLRIPPVSPARPAASPAPDVPVAAAIPAAAAALLDGVGMIEPAPLDALGALLLAREDFARDFRFLLIASLRDRCEPAHAHELARMAVAALLPVLEDTRAALSTRPELRHAAYTLVSGLATAAPCGKPLHVVIGGYLMDLEPERYAAAFPDSYFVPDLDKPSSDIAGRDLGSRVADPCTPIVYAALPLNAERSWECTGLRAMLRRRLRTTCAEALREGKTADARMAQRLVGSIRDELQKLPTVCR